MKSKQFCSVCKQWLDMEIVPTGNGDDDDGVVWFRCPRCQGFLPKLSSALENATDDDDDAVAAETTPTAVADDTTDNGAGDVLWESPADMMAAQAAPQDLVEDSAKTESPDDVADEVSTNAEKDEGHPPPVSDPSAEYAALLAEVDAAAAIPYRPWETYEVGQCVHHLAWEECGVVVAKEDLPGGRHVIKCYFEDAGVVRLIEKDSR